MSAWTALNHLVFVGGICLALIGCATTPQYGPTPASPPTLESMGAKSITHPGARDRQIARAGDQNASPAVLDSGPTPTRHGLATSFGESLDSEIIYKDFKRGFLAKPFAVGVLHYNDAEGAVAMANSLGTPIPLRGGLITSAKGVLDWGLKSPHSHFLGGYLVDGKVILSGERHDRYAIVLRNNTRQPLEFVVSVDGLDVMDGEPASYSKRGYIVGPKRSLEIDGFRTSPSRVAAFRFGEVSDSYAALRHGDTRNVGVVGVAVFSQNGKNPWILPNDDPKREEANPFPGQRFAVPPN